MIEKAFRQYVLDDAAITALIVVRIYRLIPPQKLTVPALVFVLVSDVRGHHLRGPDGLATTRVQLDAYAVTPDAMTTLVNLCRARLDGKAVDWTDGASPPTRSRVVVRWDVGHEDFDRDVNGGLCRYISEYRLTHTTAGGTI